MRRAFFVILPDTHIMDLAGPSQIVCTISELGIAPVTVRYVGPRHEVRSFQQISLNGIEPLPKKLGRGDVVFVIGIKLSSAWKKLREFAEVVAWLREVCHPESGVELCGICTGTFLLGAAGHLDGRFCTTHHSYINKLRREFPQANALENRVYVRDGTLVTSAGVTAGIDATLHIVAHCFDATAALRVARENSVNFRRFSADPDLNALYQCRAHVNPLIHEVQDWMSEHAVANTSCIDVAAEFGVSYRHLARLFLQETGVTLKHYQLTLKLGVARQLLKQGEIPLEYIADRCGFGSIQSLRATWNKYEDCSLSGYRKKYKARHVSHTVGSLTFNERP